MIDNVQKHYNCTKDSYLCISTALLIATQMYVICHVRKKPQKIMQ
jgi:hypothetical protein